MNRFILLFSALIFSATLLNAQGRDELFFVFLNTNPHKEALSKSKVKDIQSTNLENIEHLAQDDKLIANGLFNTGDEMLVIKARNQFEARDYLNTDPSIKANGHKLEILPFMAWNGGICAVKESNQMATYQFVRLISNPDFEGDEGKMVHDNRIFMSDIFNNNPGEVLVYGFFSEYNDGMAVFSTSAERAENLIKEHPAIKAGQLNFEIKTLTIAKGSFCE